MVTGARRSDEEEAEEGKHEVATHKRTIDAYIEGFKKNTQFFTDKAPEELVNEIGGYLQELHHICVLDDKKYKFRVKLTNGPDAEQEEEPLEFSIKILQAKDGKYCVEFNRVAGNQLQFFETYHGLMDELADLVSA